MNDSSCPARPVAAGRPTLPPFEEREETAITADARIKIEEFEEE